jgi:hypothetical protein
MLHGNRSNAWSPDGVLPRSLLLTAHPDLLVHHGTIDAPAGAPYRVSDGFGSVVQVEILSDDGTLVTGYTVRNRLPQRRHHWWNRKR